MEDGDVYRISSFSFPIFFPFAKVYCIASSRRSELLLGILLGAGRAKLCKINRSSKIRLSTTLFDKDQEINHWFQVATGHKFESSTSDA